MAKNRAAAAKKKMELAWSYIEKWWQHCQAGATVDTARSRGRGKGKGNLGKRGFA